MTGRWQRFCLWGVAFLLLYGGLRFGSPLWRTRQANLREQKRVFERLPVLTSDDRILAIFPHCDDETLGAGGFLSEAVRAGATVKIVIATNGDGFGYAAVRAFNDIRLSHDDYLRLGRMRQQEARAALAVLGIPTKDVTFLGYPDRGTAHMWTSNWSTHQLYTSPRTGESRSPYANAYRTNAPYYGRALLDDLKAILMSFRPTLVVYPHPNDNHSDHWALNCFVRAALHETRETDDPEQLLYLVHRGNWPVPQGLRLANPLPPPAALVGLDTSWRAFPLSPELTRRKYQAILSHQSQTKVMKRFLLSFARRNEILGRMPARSLAVAPSGRITLSGRSEEWRGIRPAIRDPAQDQARVDLMPGGDITKIYVTTDRERLYVRALLWRPASRLVVYRVHLHPVGDRLVGPPLSYTIRANRPPSDVAIEISGRSVEISLPWGAEHRRQGVMLSVDTMFRQYTLDRSAWMLLAPPADTEVASEREPAGDDVPTSRPLVAVGSSAANAR